ncbi:MAG: hypothetical protein U5K30_16710 [Acidimicrobiales bacterium]|nr:hypothetical protein [Acidimicrobiales bacterium]
MLPGVVPDLPIGRRVELDIDDVQALGERIPDETDERRGSALSTSCAISPTMVPTEVPPNDERIVRHARGRGPTTEDVLADAGLLGLSGDAATPVAGARPASPSPSRCQPSAGVPLIEVETDNFTPSGVPLIVVETSPVPRRPTFSRVIEADQTPNGRMAL